MIKELILNMLLDLSNQVAASETDDDYENYLRKYETVLTELNLDNDSLDITSLNEEFFIGLQNRITDLLGSYRYDCFAEADPNLIIAY